MPGSKVLLIPFGGDGGGWVARSTNTEMNVRLRWVLAGLVGLFSIHKTAQATPAMARQVNMQCTACHTEFPVLNDLGRSFKLGGYTRASGDSALPPVSFMMIPGFTHTQAGVPGGAAPRYAENNNFSLGSASLFYTGRLFGPYADKIASDGIAEYLNKVGVFYQHTYDFVERSWAWDNVEIRYADSGKILNTPIKYGVYANNNPTLQDPWNTLSAWGFPFNTSPLASTPAASLIMDGVFSQQVVGAGAYALVNNSFYFDAALYHTLGTGFQKTMGIDPSEQSQIPNVAPYWRAAYTLRDETGSDSWAIGTHGMFAETYPSRVSTAGKDQSLDVGVDTQYQTMYGNNDLLAMLAWTHETQMLNASKALDLASNSSDNLWKGTATFQVLHDKTYGFSGQYFVTDGTRDLNKYTESVNGAPLSDGIILEADWLPLNKSGGPSFWPRTGVKFSLQYVIYNRYNGARYNYDGQGTSASANNTVYLSAWINF